MNYTLVKTITDLSAAVVTVVLSLLPWRGSI